MDYELSAWIMIGVLSIASIVLLIVKARKKKQPTSRRHVDRVSARRSETPQKEEKPIAPKLPFYDVERPGLLLFSSTNGESRLMIQRAQRIDEAYFRTLTEDKNLLKAFNSLFARANALMQAPQDNLCPDLFTVNFGDIAQDRIDEVLTVRALTVHGQAMGEALRETVEAKLVADLQKLTQVTGIDRDLKKAIDRERLGLDKVMARASLFLGDDTKAFWETHLAELQALIDLKDKNDLVSRINALRSVLHDAADRLDGEIGALGAEMKDLSTTDKALTRAMPLIEERELTVRALFLLSIIKITGENNYFDGMQSATRLERNAKAFPSVETMLQKARHVIFDVAENAGREMKDEDLALLGQIKKEIEELHAEAVAARSRLREESAYLQSVVDDYLIHRDMAPRYAVRLDRDGNVDALLVLHRH